MKTVSIYGREYKTWLRDLKTKIRNSQLKAALNVNAQLLLLYWELGKAINDKQEQTAWGDKVIMQLASDLSSEFGDIQGFSRSNLFNIRKWYRFYNGNNQIVQHRVGLFPAALGLVPWGHHIQIVTKCQTAEEALFYVEQTVKHNWKRTVLMQHIDARLFQRRGRARNNFKQTLPKPQSELAEEILNNPYNLGFLCLGEAASEKELEDAIINNIIKFLRELGPAFALIGRQYHLRVSDKDYHLDLLFYHTRLHCYMVIELKVTEFIPEHAGKLDFYINVVDEQIKMPEDNPTIGLLLCKTADNVIVEYSLRSKIKPISVAEYKQTLPKEWRKELPDVHILKEALSKEIPGYQHKKNQQNTKIKKVIDNIKVKKKSTRRKLK